MKSSWFSQIRFGTNKNIANNQTKPILSTIQRTTMKLHILLSSIFVIPSLAATTSRRNLREEESDRGGGGGGGGGGGKSNNRPDDRGRQPFGGDWDEPDLVTIEGCDASLECDLRNGQVGTFVCRSWTNPVFGDTQFRPLCIPNDRAWSTDECGCCLVEETGLELECPFRPEFTTLQCDNSTQPDAVLLPAEDTVDSQVERAADRDFGAQNQQDRQFICRDLINPFTGVVQDTTLFAPNDRVVESDTCGCCDSTGCPERDENGRRPDLFDRPDFIEKSCAAEDEANNIACDLRPSDEEEGDETSTQGFFVCREMFDPRGSGGSRKEAVCISESRAWETDECGCCDGEDCPERPRAVDIDCSIETTNEDHSCDLQSGEEGGVFVCRTIFHPFDGQARERGFCIPASRGWVTDVCGCCEDGCPTSPTEGFDTEAAQLEVLALEVPEDYGIDSSTESLTEGSSSAMMNQPPASRVVISGALIVTGLGIFSL